MPCSSSVGSAAMACTSSTSPNMDPVAPSLHDLRHGIQTPKLRNHGVPVLPLVIQRPSCGCGCFWPADCLPPERIISRCVQVFLEVGAHMPKTVPDLAPC